MIRRLSVKALLRCLLGAAGLLPWALLLAGPEALGLRTAFHLFCHQLPERTLTIVHASMVVCSRCAGIYLGVALGALLPPVASLARHGRLVVLISAGAMCLDVFLHHAPIHTLRLGTGLAVGWSASAFLFAALAGEPRSGSIADPAPSKPW